MNRHTRQWNMIYTALLLMTSFRMVFTDGPEKASITHYDGRLLRYAAAGDVLQIYCDLKNSECDNIKAGDTLTLAPHRWIHEVCRKDKVTCSHSVDQLVAHRGWNITRRDPCHVMFTGTFESSVNDSIVKYTCFRNESFLLPLRNEELHILGKPLEPRILKIICSENKDIVVIFDTLQPRNVQTTEYRVSMTEYESVIDLCLTNCSFPPSQHSNICVCRYKNMKKNIDVRVYKDVNVTITVNVSRPDQSNPIVSAMTAKEINLYQHVRPGKVVELFCHNVSANDAVVIFTPSTDILYLVPFMNIYHKPLLYSINLIKTQGLQEIFETRIDKTVFNHTYPYSHTAVRFRNLTAFTKYLFSVSGIGGGGRGSQMTMEFTTNKTVPSHPPIIEDFSYMRKYDGKSLTLHLLWQPLTQESRGGEKLTYDLQIIFQNGSDYNETNLFVNYTHGIHNLPPEQLTVQLWAVNEIGRSVNCSKIIIPDNIDAIQPSMYVELENNAANIYINLSNSDVVEMIAIHSCEGNKDICTEYPYTQIEKINQTNLRSNFLTFRMTIPTESTTIRKYVQEVEHFELADKQNPLKNAKFVVGNITVGQVNAEPDNIDIFEMESPLNVTAWIEREVLEKSNANGLIKQNSSHKMTTATRFFLSVKVKGFWMGMVATDCYFDRNKDEAKLIVIPFDNNMYLRLNQGCDMYPTQFLVGSYKLYSSDDEHCKQMNPEINQLIENKNMFSPTIFKLPETTSLGFCVEALGLNISGHSKAHFQHISLFAGMKPETVKHSVIVITSITTGAVVLVAILGIIWIIKFKRRGQHFHNFGAVLNEMDERERDKDFQQHFNGVINDNRSDSHTESRDSGHGSTTSSGHEETDEVFLNEHEETTEEGTKLLHSCVESGLSSLNNKHDKSCDSSNNTQDDGTDLSHDEFSFSKNLTNGSSTTSMREFNSIPHSSSTQENSQDSSQSNNTVDDSSNLNKTSSSRSYSLSTGTSSNESELNKYWQGGNITFRPPPDDGNGFSSEEYTWSSNDSKS